MSCSQRPPSAWTLIWMWLPGTGQRGHPFSCPVRERPGKLMCWATQGLKLCALGSLILLCLIQSSPPSSLHPEALNLHLGDQEAGVGSFPATNISSSQPPHTLTQMEKKLLSIEELGESPGTTPNPLVSSEEGKCPAVRVSGRTSLPPSVLLPLVTFPLWIHLLSQSDGPTHFLQNTTRPVCKGRLVLCPSGGFANSHLSGGSWMCSSVWFIISPRESGMSSGLQNSSEGRSSVCTLGSQSEISRPSDDLWANIPWPTIFSPQRSRQSEIIWRKSFHSQHPDLTPQVRITKGCWTEEAVARCYACFHYQVSYLMHRGEWKGRRSKREEI